MSPQDSRRTHTLRTLRHATAGDSSAKPQIALRTRVFHGSGDGSAPKSCMKTEDGGAAPQAKDAACHILINAFIWRHLSPRCRAATETLRLLGDGDLRRRLLFFSLFIYVLFTTPSPPPATHCCVPALQQRLGVPEQQSVVRIHDVGLGLLLLVLRVRLVEGLLVVLVHGSALTRSPTRRDWTVAPQSQYLSQQWWCVLTSFQGLMNCVRA